MRQKNWRFVITGTVLVTAAVAFFFYFMSIAGRSNDPQQLMQTVGTTAGVVGGLGLVMAIFGLIGRKA
jgi:hypothetical protein